MQIITTEDSAFEQFLALWRDAKLVGKYWANGQIKLVCVTNQYLLIGLNSNPTKIAIKAVKSIAEAESFAQHLLSREKSRGHKVELQ
ncbi:MAG: hypothetical protein DCC75_05230 [Proteobacteria bacterium]|nr:MAG: hypothetical protein DCC75_05230 [Pseudomonadota bacterium]